MAHVAADMSATLRGMSRVRAVLVLLAILGALIVAMVVQRARDHAHQLPLGTSTMGRGIP